MNKKRPRIIGTTDNAIEKAETELNFKFPESFRNWLIQNNGLGIEDVYIFPVFDERDPRKTWDSIIRNYNENWLAWLENFEDEEMNFEHLLPFAEFGTGDYYCCDYSKSEETKEIPVVHWSHETGETEFRGANFEDFLEKLKRGDFDFD
ncbi:hypothetical protein BH20ACI1_BH20ACI1_15210 [soil metagenome]